MAHLSKIFSKTPVDIPNRSGFDISHENMLTMTTGTLVPVLCEEVLPGESFSLGYMAQVQLPPMATDFYGRVDLRLEAFFVPNRILWSGWQNFVTMPVDNPFAPNVVRHKSVPSFIVEDDPDSLVGPYKFNELFGAGSLSDYLGLKVDSNEVEWLSFNFGIKNLLPYFAYHKIYDDWYRNPNIEKPLFVRPASDSITWSVSSLPWVNVGFHDQSDYNPAFKASFIKTSGADPSFNLQKSLFFLGADFDPEHDSGVNYKKYPHLFSLHQRQWAKDYYTTASLYPQSSGSISGSTVESKENFTIGQLRSANVLQRWLERNNIAGQRYSDQIKATWGVMPSDAILDRPLFLGSHKFGVYNKSVSQSSSQSDDSVGRNPYSGSLGVRAGSMSGLGDGSLIDSFSATEHGHIMVLASLVPHAYYSTGARRYLNRSEIGDFANPLLQGLGEQGIVESELTGKNSFYGTDNRVFGYQQQYAEYKYHDDEVHGLLRDGESLEAFALQRSFSFGVDLSSDFLHIPKDFLDSVTAADYKTGALTWADFYFNFKKVSPLSEYVIPTLGDLKNTHKEDVDYRGRYL